MHNAVEAEVVLPADPRNVRTARQHLRDTLSHAGLEGLIEPATLAVSEVVTNAFVHTGTCIQLRVSTADGAVRVEVEDRGLHLPSPRAFADTAGTGRGLHLLEECVDRWGTTALADGKVVWFEIGDLVDEPGRGRQDAPEAGAADTAGLAGLRSPEDIGAVRVTLRQVPLLMHLAWQEHAAALLREHLLYALESDPEILFKHAQASEAMSLLNEQLPAPALGDQPDVLMAEAIEPFVTAEEVVLVIPSASVPHFGMLDLLLRSAIAEARAGHFLGPPTQPEIEEMRQWLCNEVARQAAGQTTAIPWMARTDVRATFADQAELTIDHAQLGDVDGALLATDEASIIVAVSPAALALLGYQRAGDLLGRRLLVVVPARFHQAHIAGTTMNATNGRDNLLGVSVRVPMVRADGTEISVTIEVRPALSAAGRHVFVAHFEAADAPA